MGSSAFFFPILSLSLWFHNIIMLNTFTHKRSLFSFSCLSEKTTNNNKLHVKPGGENARKYEEVKYKEKKYFEKGLKELPTINGEMSKNFNLSIVWCRKYFFTESFLSICLIVFL